ncbi:hypothetical protein KXV85_004396, partial [Aspergillus fumigatus]
PQIFARQHPVLQRLPLSVRILRYPRALRPQPAREDTAADHCRARQAARMRHCRHRLFRGRQFHRQPQGGDGPVAASGRLAEAHRLHHPACLRGDAEYRQAARDPGEDEGGAVRHDLLRHRDSGSGRAEGDAEGPQHDGADPRGRADHQFLRHGSGVRHHHGARHRQARHRGCAARL